MIRKFKISDETRAAEIWVNAGIEEYTYLPQFQRLDKEKALKVFHMIITLESDIWLRANETEIQGFIAFQDSYIDRLYIDPKFQRQGIGTALIEFAKDKYPQGLELRTHQQNKRASAFY